MHDISIVITSDDFKKKRCICFKSIHTLPLICIIDEFYDGKGDFLYANWVWSTMDFRRPLAKLSRKFRWSK